MFGWLFRRTGWLHLSCMAFGLLGMGASVAAIAYFARIRMFLWEIGAIIAGLAFGGFLALATAGLIGRYLRRRT